MSSLIFYAMSFLLNKKNEIALNRIISPNVYRKLKKKFVSIIKGDENMALNPVAA